MPRPLILLLVICLVSATALARPVIAQEATPADTLPSVTLPPALDRVLRDYERAWRARDADGLAALFTDDGFVLSGGRPPARGQAAIRRHYTGSGGALHLRAVAYAADDTVGYIIGMYGTTPTDINLGKFVLVLRRQPAGPWRIAADMDNPNLPPRRPAGTGATPTP